MELIDLFDYAGAIFSFISTILYARNNILAWPFCIFTNIVNLYLFYQTGIFADAVLEFIYLSMALYGIWHWLYGGENHKELSVSNVPVLEAALLFGFSFIGYYGAHYILTTHTNSTVAKLDSLAMVLSLTAQWLTCRKYIQTWLVWFLADIVLAAMFYYKNLPAHLLLNLIYIPITFYGYNKWAKLQKSVQTAHDYVPELSVA